MANLFAQNTATWDSANMWNTVANGSGSYQTPAAGDVCMSNNKTVTVNISPTVVEVRNDTTGGATAGGYFDLANEVTLTANAYGGGVGSQCVRFNGVAPNHAYLAGTVYAGSSSLGASNVNTGTLHIIAANGTSKQGSVNTSTGTIVIGTATAGTTGHDAHGCNNASSGTVSATSAFGSSNAYVAHGVNNNSTGSATVTAATGGAGSPFGGNLCLGCNNATSGSLTVTTATGGSGWGAYGAFNVGAGSLIVDLAVGNGFGPGGSHTQSTPGVYGSVSGTLGRTTVKKIRSGAYGQAAIGGAVFLAPDANSTGEFLKTDFSTKTMYVSESASLGYPANADVRNGTVFDGGSRTGTCHVPAAASVLYGVPVDATTGTVTVAAADIRTALGMSSANLDTQLSGISSKTTSLLLNAPDVPTEAEIADAVRTELTPELAAVLAMGTRMAEQVPTGPVLVLPAPAAGQTIAWVMCYGPSGAIESGVTISIFLTKTTEGGAFDAAAAVLISDENGLAQGPIPRGAGHTFKARRGTNGKLYAFAGVDADTLALPTLLGSP